MPDMLVKLYDLPPLEPAIACQRERGLTIRRGMPPETQATPAAQGHGRPRPPAAMLPRNPRSITE